MQMPRLDICASAQLSTLRWAASTAALVTGNRHAAIVIFASQPSARGIRLGLFHPILLVSHGFMVFVMFLLLLVGLNLRSAHWHWV